MSSDLLHSGLHRARAPFRAKNLLTGAGIVSFTFAVYAYSISAVKQDDFSDIPAPSMEEIRQVHESKRSTEELSPSVQPSPLPPIGLLGSATSWIRSGRLSQSEWVVGAPPVDRLGHMDDRTPSESERKLV